MDRIEKKEILWSAALVAGWTLLMLLQSPNVAPHGFTYTDSSVFEYVGMVMQQGGMPYVDAFDHKGPLIYVINWLALELGGWRGTLVFEAAALAMALWFLLRIARLRAGWWSSVFLVTFFALRGADKMLEGGNLTEEYALPWIALAVYLFLRFLQQGVFRTRDSVLLGFGLAMVLLLRPNMIAAWAVGYPVLLFLLWKQGNAGRMLLASRGGLLIGLAPFVLWLAAGGALQACWETYIVFNVTYAARMAGDHAARQRLRAFCRFFLLCKMGYVLLPCGFALLRERALRDRAAGFSLALLLVSLLSVSMSGMTYSHYGMVLLPTLIYPAALFFSYAEQHVRGRVQRYAVGLMVVVAFFMLRTSYQNIHSNWRVDDPELQRLVDAVQENTTPEDTISVWGNQDAIYVRSQRRSASIYSYQRPIATVVDPQIGQRYFEELEAAPPKLVILCDEGNERMQSFLETHGYVRIPDASEKTPVYRRTT